MDHIDIVKAQEGYTKSKLKSLLFCGKLRKLNENQKVKPRQGRWIHKSVIALLLKHSKSDPIIPNCYQSFRTKTTLK